MRRYLIASNGDDLAVKEERVKSTIAKVEFDPTAQKAILRLEARPLITSNVDKERGHVFYFESSSSFKDVESGDKLMGDALHDGNLMMSRLGFEDLWSKLELSKSFKEKTPLAAGFTEYGSSPNEVGPFGARVVKEKSRKKQVKRLRKLNQSKDVLVGPTSEFKRHRKGVMAPKRKMATQPETISNLARRKNQKVIPLEGSPDL